MLGNADNLELVFLIGFATFTGYVCLLLPYRVVVHAHIGRLVWTKCIYARHGIIIADALIGYVYRTMSPCTCIDVHQCVAILPRVVLQSKKLNLFRYCMLHLRPFLLLHPPYQVIKNLWIASNAHAAIAHEPNSSVDLANKT